MLPSPVTPARQSGTRFWRRTCQGGCRRWTTLMIAHKLSTVIRADRIYVLEEGEITEEGTHEELTARGGAYERAFRLQTIPGQDVR